MKPRPKARTIAEYLAEVPAGQRAALTKLRKAIHAAMPDAEECISYGLPAFRHDGKVQVWFGAATNHCSFYPGAVISEFKDELRGYETSKGTIRFSPEEPLPVALVRKLVRARIANNAAAARSGKRTPRRRAAR